jgi:hypothetical protein
MDLKSQVPFPTKNFEKSHNLLGGIRKNIMFAGKRIGPHASPKFWPPGRSGARGQREQRLGEGLVLRGEQGAVGSDEGLDLVSVGQEPFDLREVERDGKAA